MNIAKTIATENVVHLSTYKMAKSMVSRDYITYKNKFFSMKPHERAAEKSAVEARASSAPYDFSMRMCLAAIQEVERG